MLSTLSIYCLTILAVITASLTSFNQNRVSSTEAHYRDSSDSTLEVNFQASINKYGTIISDYNGREFSRDSLIIKLEQTVARSSSDSQEIWKSLYSFGNTVKVGDTVKSEGLLRPFFLELKTAYSDLISNEGIIATATRELGAIKNTIKEIEPAYLTATQTFSKIIPDSYVGKLNLVYKGNAYTVFITDSKVHNVNISRSNPSGRTLKEGWSNLAKGGMKPIAIFNGGMFNPDYSPTGLLIENNQKISELNTVVKEGTGNFFLFPNGIFLIDTSNNFHVVETKEFIKKFGATKSPAVKAATQSGPMLLVNNKIHRSFTNGSSNLNIRNAVGTNTKFPHRVFFAISNDRVNFYDFAVLFKDLLRCDNALYLDGVISRMYIDHKGIRTGKLDSDLPLGPLITISQKK